MKRFNVGIVGYGWAATAHIPAINAGALGQVTRICSSRSLAARELSAKHDCALQTGTDYAALQQGADMPLTGLPEAVLTHEVIFAADLSQQLGRPVKLAEVRKP